MACWTRGSRIRFRPGLIAWDRNWPPLAAQILCASYIFAFLNSRSLPGVKTGQRNRIGALCQTYTDVSSRSVTLRGMNGCEVNVECRRENRRDEA